MSEPRLLDLFCGAGGCSVGYARAGFEVVGVDIEPQPRYPFEFHQYDAMTFPLDGFDVVHASPPCQMYSRALKHLSGPQPMLIDAVLVRLEENARPFIVENVEGAPLPTQSDLFGSHGVMLCGTMFGLRVYRHRLFQTSWSVTAPRACDHLVRPINPHNSDARELIYDEFGRDNPEIVWRREMGLDWMGRYEAREAIPPAYTQFIGEQLMAHLSERAA